MSFPTRKDSSVIARCAMWSTVVMLLIIPIQIAVFIALPMPTSAAEWISLFEAHPFASLLHLDLLYIVNNALICVMYTGLFVLLIRESGGLALIALILGLVGAAAYFPTVRAFEVLRVSRLYMASESTTVREGLLSVVEGMLAVWQGTGFATYYLLSAVSLLVFAIAMFKSASFKRSISFLALLAGVLMIVPSTAGDIGLVFSLLSLIPWILFSVLLALKFRRFARESDASA